MGIEKDQLETFLGLFHPEEERQKYAFHLFELFESIPDLPDEDYRELLARIATDASDNARILAAYLACGIWFGKQIDTSLLPSLQSNESWKTLAVQRLLLDEPGPASNPHRNDFHVAAGAFGLLSGFGYPDVAEWVLERSAKLHARYFEENDLRERRLDQTWFLAIGHFAISILFLAAAQRGVISSSRVQNGRVGRNGNEYLFQLANRTFSDAILTFDMNFNALPFGKFAMEQIRDRIYLVSDVVEKIDREVDPEATGILALDEATRSRLRAWVLEQGQDPTKPIVTVHVRTDGYRSNVPSGMRSWNIKALFSSIRMLVGEGCLVVRLGDPSMPRIAEFEGFIDYAHSDARSPELDIAFVAEAAFHIGSSSGMSLVPILFGTPCLMLNWYMRVHAGPWGRRCWTVFKKITDLQTGEPVQDFERLRVLGMAEYHFVHERYGAKLENLSEEEILRAVERFMADEVSNRRTDVKRLPGPRNFIFDQAGKMVECDIYGIPGGGARGFSHKPEGYSISEREAG